MICRVVKSTGSVFTVVGENGETLEARVRGRLRLSGSRSTSPVAIGDMVKVEDGAITDVLDRKNYIIRKSSNLSKQSQVLAANIDQAVLVVTLAMPETPAEFIDRYLVTAYAYRVPVIMVFNKIDLYTWWNLTLLKVIFYRFTRLGRSTMNNSTNGIFWNHDLRRSRI